MDGGERLGELAFRAQVEPAQRLDGAVCGVGGGGPVAEPVDHDEPRDAVAVEHQRPVSVALFAGHGPRAECVVKAHDVKSIAALETEHEDECYPVRELLDRVRCAAMARRFARAAGLDAISSVAVGTAASELASNAVRHAGGGLVRLRVLRLPRPAIELVVTDQGPGIATYCSRSSTASRGARLLPDGMRGGLGAGLGAVARLMDELTIETVPRQGTRLTALKWLTRHPRR